MMDEIRKKKKFMLDRYSKVTASVGIVNEKTLKVNLHKEIHSTTMTNIENFAKPFKVKFEVVGKVKKQ